MSKYPKNFSATSEVLPYRFRPRIKKTAKKAKSPASLPDLQSLLVDADDISQRVRFE